MLLHESREAELKNILTLLFIGLVAPSATHAEEFHGYACTNDCSGHIAGFEWAKSVRATRQDQCFDAKSISFFEGCVANVEQYIMSTNMPEKEKYLITNDDRIRVAREEFRRVFSESKLTGVKNHTIECYDTANAINHLRTRGMSPAFSQMQFCWLFHRWGEYFNKIVAERNSRQIDWFYTEFSLEKHMDLMFDFAGAGESARLAIVRIWNNPTGGLP